MSVKIMAKVWDSALPRDEKNVALAYADHASHDGTNVWPSVALVAWKTGYSERSVQIITRKLEARGVLISDGRGPHGENKWAFDIDAFPERPSWAQERERRGAKTAPQGPGEGVQETELGGAIPAERGADSASEPSCNHHKTPDANASGAAKPPLAQRERKPARSGKAKKPKRETPPAVKTFRANAHRYPAKSWWEDIERAVGSDPPALELWGRIVKAYVGLGWNPGNVKNMLEFYGRREIPTTRRNGNGAHRGGRPAAGADYNTPTQEQVERDRAALRAHRERRRAGA